MCCWPIEVIVINTSQLVEYKINRRLVYSESGILRKSDFSVGIGIGFVFLLVSSLGGYNRSSVNKMKKAKSMLVPMPTPNIRLSKYTTF